MKISSQHQKLINTFSGFKYELFILIGSILTSYTYSWLDKKVINQQLIVIMLRVFIAFADLGIFLAIGHLIEFRRGIWVFYIYKILSILQLDMNKIQSSWEYVYQTVGVSFCLMLYYKITLFLLIFTASYIVEMQHQDSILQKQQNEQNQQKLIQKQQQQDKHKLFSRQQRKQMYGQQSIKKQQQQRQTQKTIQRIKLSLRYHKQNEFYKKLQVFYFIIYNSTCLMVLFPLQEHVLDFTKGIGYKNNKGQDLLLGSTFLLDAANDQLRWLIDVLTVINVIGYWGIVMIGEFWIKTKYPELVKEYISRIPMKFLLIQLLSLFILIVVLVTTPLTQVPQGEQQNVTQHQQSPKLINFINPWLFLSCYLIHSVLPLLIIFILYRLYLGLIYTLNHMVSTRFSYYQSTTNDEQTNLDSLLYQSISLNDLNKVRHFIISQSQLLPRHKLKRYTEQQTLKHYVQENTVIEIQQMFQDFLVLDLYNKLSRWLAIWIFYLLLIVFLIGMTINDSHLVTQDKFFIQVPVILLVIGFLIVNKYSSSPNIFYPKIILWLNNKYNQFLAYHKAYHFIRLNHFYAILFSIWAYRVYAYIFISTHQSIQEEIKLRLYHYYTDDNIMENWLFKKLLYGWAKYFMTHTSQCDYNLKNVIIDTFMVGLIITQLLMQKKFADMKKKVKKDPILLFLKFITPFYAFYIFVIEMQCLEWSRVVFCTALCVGVMFIHLNWTQLERGIKRNQQGEFDD